MASRGGARGSLSSISPEGNITLSGSRGGKAAKSGSMSPSSSSPSKISFWSGLGEDGSFATASICIPNDLPSSPYPPLLGNIPSFKLQCPPLYSLSSLPFSSFYDF